MSQQSLLRRLRRYLQDLPYPVSTGAAGASVDISAGTDSKFLLTIDDGGPLEIDLAPLTGLVSGQAIALRMQQRIRAALPNNLSWCAAKVTFDPNAVSYVVRGGVPTTDGNVTIMDAVADNVADDLLIGEANGGVQSVQPTASYCDDELIQWLMDALAWAKSNCSAYEPYTLETLPDSLASLVVYYAWREGLHFAAGGAVYAYNQRLGGDQLGLSDIFQNLRQLLNYLRDQINDMLEDCPGFTGDAVTTNLFRMDRRTDQRVPDYVTRPFPRPELYVLRKMSNTSAILEWQEVTIPDLEDILVWTSTSQGIVERWRLTNKSPVDANDRYGVKPDATLSRRLHNEWQSAAAVQGLTTGTVYFVVAFRDVRGAYRYSDEWSLDLSVPNPVPVRVVNNAQPTEPLE